MQTRNPKDFWPGLIYLFFGISAIIIARDYKMGTAFKMGPAYFPVVLSVILILIGVASLVRSFLKPGSPVGKISLRSVLLITGATILFGVLARGAGLIVAMPVLVVVSAFASLRFRWSYALALSAGLTAACILIFLKGLGIPLPIVGSWLIK